MDQHTVYLALGSNLGDRAANLKSAIRHLPPQLEVLQKSPVYETPPWGYADQPHFLNQVVRARTYETPEALLKHLKRLEVVLGREPGFRNGPRLIDLDILFYDDLVLNSPPLVLPHPNLHERGFVLVPLNDIAPVLMHPVLKKTVRELAAGSDSSQIKPYENEVARAAPLKETAMTENKPLNWSTSPGIGYTVVRRADGGMTLTFTDLSDATLKHWREFALEHLFGSDRRTRNLYDLRAVKEIPEPAIRAAVEANSDPSARNIRVAVVVADAGVAQAVRNVAAMALPETASALKLFTDMDEAEAWLGRPLDQIP